MNKLTAKKLRIIRNSIIVVGIALAFVIWLQIPSVIENSALFHVGNGKYGSKMGALLLLFLPLFALIPNKPGDEIHTEDIAERAKIEEEWEVHSLKTQITYAVCETMVACFCMLLGVVLG